MTHIYEKAQAALAYLRTIFTTEPTVGIILGSGLGNLIEAVDVQHRIPYGDIPHFLTSTAPGHQGQLIIGTLGGKQVVIMQGRFHYYEGYSMPAITFPVRVMKFLKVKTLFITNVAGSTNANYQAGDLVFLKDHINLQPDNPLRGENDERLGPRFPDMLHTYNARLRKAGINYAKSKGYRVHEGVYLALPGPNLETPAEYEFIHRMGADLVGMSTVPEVLVARHASLEVVVLSIVSNTCYPISKLTETTVEEVLAVAKKSQPKMSDTLIHLIQSLPS